MDTRQPQSNQPDPKRTTSESNAAIHQLLSRFLDLELSTEERRLVESNLANNPKWQQQLDEMLLLRDGIQGMAANMASDNHSLPEQDQAVMDGMWESISQQLHADAKEVSQDDFSARLFTDEFISAYVDGEISSADPLLTRFEKHLNHTDGLHTSLAGFHEISDTVRQYADRAEAACTLDVAASVMARYAAAPTEELIHQTSDTEADDILLPWPTLTESETPQVSFEDLTAYQDRELTDKERLQVSKSLENCSVSKAYLKDFQTISSRIQNMVVQLEAQAPDLWPIIRDKVALEQTAARPASTPLFRYALPTAAAVLLLVVGMNLFSAVEQKDTQNQVANKKPATAETVVASASEEKEEMSMVNRLVANLPFHSAKVEPAEDENQSQTLGGSSFGAPVRDPNEVKAELTEYIESEAKHLASVDPSVAEGGLNQDWIPSPEEYVFSANESDMPEGEVSTVVGIVAGGI